MINDEQMSNWLGVVRTSQLVICCSGWWRDGFFMVFSLQKLGEDYPGTYTPLKINMEHNHGGMEDHFPF